MSKRPGEGHTRSSGCARGHPQAQLAGLGPRRRGARPADRRRDAGRARAIIRREPRPSAVPARARAPHHRVAGEARQAICRRASRLDPSRRSGARVVAVAGGASRPVAFAAAGLVSAAHATARVDGEPHSVCSRAITSCELTARAAATTRAVSRSRARGDSRDLSPERLAELSSLVRELEATGAPAVALCRSRAARSPAHDRSPAPPRMHCALRVRSRRELFRRALTAPIIRRRGVACCSRNSAARSRTSAAPPKPPSVSSRPRARARRIRRAARSVAARRRALPDERAARARLRDGASVLARFDMVLPATRTRAIAGIVWNQIRMRGPALEWTTAHRARRSARRRLLVDRRRARMVDSLLGAYFSGRAARLALAHGQPLQIARALAAAVIGAALLGRRARTEHCSTRAGVPRPTPTHRSPRGTRSSRAPVFLLDHQFRASAKRASALEGDWYAAGHGQGWETDVALHFSLASQMMLGECPSSRGASTSRSTRPPQRRQVSGGHAARALRGAPPDVGPRRRGPRGRDRRGRIVAARDRCVRQPARVGAVEPHAARDLPRHFATTIASSAPAGGACIAR